jgi:hypothetical protein
MPSLRIADFILNILLVFRRHVDGKFKRAGLILRHQMAEEIVEEAGSGRINNVSLYKFPYLYYTA